MRAGKSIYLACYGIVMTLGWAAVAARVAWDFQSTKGVRRAAAWPATILQSCLLLDTAHAVLRLVKSSPVSSFIQWLGRTHALLLVEFVEPSVMASPWAAVMFLAWSVGETCRHPMYVADNLGLPSPALTWLRYTAFIPLYPIGLAAELANIYRAIPLVAASGKLSVTMPNAANMAFDYPLFLRTILVVQPIIWLNLYHTVLRQRARKLAPASASSAPAAAKWKATNGQPGSPQGSLKAWQIGDSNGQVQSSTGSLRERSLATSNVRVRAA